MILDAAAVALEPALAALRMGAPLSAAAVSRLREPAQKHGIWLLLAHHAMASGTHDAASRQVLSQALRDAAARDALQRAAHRSVVEAFASAGVECLVLKGAHLAGVLYASPHLRPYSDLDLLVSPLTRARAWEVLTATGYSQELLVTRDAVLAEMAFTRTESGVHHFVDLHWRALSPLPFQHLLPFDDVWHRSQPIPALGEQARGLGDSDALLHVVAHLAAHHGTAPRLIWLADLDRLARRLDAERWMKFTAAACHGGLAAVTLEVIRTASRLFGTPVPDSVMRTLAAAAPGAPIGLAFLEPRSKAGRMWIELRALTRWRERIRLVAQHLVPDRRYMEQRYGVRGAGLVRAYAHRATTGAWHWLKRPDI